jgi:hypothetical protein
MTYFTGYTETLDPDELTKPPADRAPDTGGDPSQCPSGAGQKSKR